VAQDDQRQGSAPARIVNVIIVVCHYNILMRGHTRMTYILFSMDGSFLAWDYLGGKSGLYLMIIST